MAQRVAVLGVLNKRNGIVRDVTLRPGQSARWKDLLVRLRACETSAPWEERSLPAPSSGSMLTWRCGPAKVSNWGKLSGTAARVIDADGMVVSPGFIDNHCHYDAQVLWDLLCSFSCYHGATTVIIGNCSLALAPLRPGPEERVAEFLPLC